MIVYRAQNIINGKIYIGYTGGTIEKRMYAHYWSANNKSTTHFHNALRKYKTSDWKWTVLEEHKTLKEVTTAEKRLIAENKSMELGYNMTEGGDGGFTGASEKTREKISKANKGCIPWNKGAQLTQEYKDKISASLKGRIRTKESIEQGAAAHRGMKRPSETRQKMQEAWKRRKPSTCPHCKLTGGGGAMKRWHFDNCGERKIILS